MRLYEYFKAHRGVLYVVICVAAALSVWGASQIEFEEDVSEETDEELEEDDDGFEEDTDDWLLLQETSPAQATSNGSTAIRRMFFME